MTTVPEPSAAPPDDVQIALTVATDNGPKPDDPDQELISQDPNVSYDDEGDD